MDRLTKEQGAVLGAFTGFLCGKFSDMHQYIEKIMGRPVFTHELANPETVAQIKEKSTADFMSITAE